MSAFFKNILAAITAAQSKAEIVGIGAAVVLAARVLATEFTGTITFEITVDGLTWHAIEMLPTTDLADTALTSTCIGAGAVSASYVSKAPVACSGFRARCTAFTSAEDASVVVRAAEPA